MMRQLPTLNIQYQRIISCYLLAFLTFGVGLEAFAQIPEAVGADSFDKLGTEERAIPCSLNDAGTIIPGAAVAQSNDLTLDTIFLCFSDQILIDHNGDQRLDGDPDPSTQGGVAYAWYECPPSVDGPTLGAVAADPCLIDNPGAPAGSPPFFVTSGGRFDGDVLFFNQGAVQTAFNGGNPYLVWFAPITFDSLEVNGTSNTIRYENGGSCVSVSTDAAFAVVYLNAIIANNLQVNNCTGTFSIRGGLPGWRPGDRYTIDIVNTANPAITGTVLNPTVASGGVVRFSVPTAGNYRISVTDGKGCQVVDLQADMTSCVPADRVKLSIDSIIGAPGATVCVPITVTGFQNIVSFQFGLDYDEILLRFINFQNAGFAPFTTGDYNDNGDEVIVGAASFASPYNIPDGGVLFEMCFEILGLEGEVAPIVVSEPVSGIEFASTSGILDFDLCDGAVIITSNTVAVLAAQAGMGCGGEDENFFVAQVVGGTQPYTVTWQNAGGGPTLGPVVLTRQNEQFATPANLPPGMYNVTVVDGAGNTDVTTITLTDGPTLGVYIDRISNLRCFGDQNGALFAVPTLNFTDVTNPGSNYSFSWTGGSAAQGINNLGVGNYTVTVTDSRGCTATASNTITAPSPVSVTLTVTDATCTGLTDGEIFVQTSGGTPSGTNYTYSFTGPNGVTANSSTRDLTINSESGPYQITIIDNNGCRVDTSATVGAQRAIGLTPNVTEISCAGANDGQIVVVASATLGTANPPFMFTWFGAGGSNSTSTQSTLPNLGQGTYRVVAEDSDGCIVRDTFTLIEPPQLQISLVATGNESCNPGADGFAEVSATGGRNNLAPYQFQWQDASGALVANTASATGLTAGSYQAYVIDQSGCIDSLPSPQIITAPSRPVVQVLDDDLLRCNGLSDGSLSVNAIPGAAPIDRYVWDSGQQGSTISNLPAGIYAVEIFDQAGCVTRDTAEVLEPDVLEIDTTILTSPPCFEGGDGAIEVVMIGGTAPYTYTWSDGTTGVGINQITGATITAGNYFVTIVDANNCPPVQENFFLDDPAGINPTESNIVTASCASGVNDGGLTVSADLPGAPGASFIFTWSSGETTTGISSTASMLPGGRITVAIQEASGACPPQEFSYEIPAPDPLIPAVGLQEDVRCAGEDNGRIVIDTVFGGTPTFTYTWNYNGNTFVGNELNNIPAAEIALEVQDANGCTLLDTFQISEPQPLELSLDSLGTFPPTCNDSENGLISLFAIGGNPGPPYTYRWNDDPNRNSPVARDIPGGTYTALVTDFKGCVDSFVYTLVQPDPVDFTLAPFEDLVCFGDLTVLRVEDAFGGQGANLSDYQVSINGSSFQEIGTDFQVPGGVLIPITVIDAAECEYTEEILIPAPPQITVRLPESVEVELGDSIRLRPDIFPGGAPIDFSRITWTPDTSISFRNGNLADPYVSPSTPTTYTITVVDEDGCTESASVLVEVDRNRNVFIPNAFSPNNDSNNDIFQIFTGPGVESISYLRIFDRWGETVFSADDLPLNDFGQQGTWDGTFRGQRVSTGVYVYVAEITFQDGKTLIYKGDITVMY